MLYIILEWCKNKISVNTEGTLCVGTDRGVQSIVDRNVHNRRSLGGGRVGGDQPLATIHVTCRVTTALWHQASIWNQSQDVNFSFTNAVLFLVKNSSKYKQQISFIHSDSVDPPFLSLSQHINFHLLIHIHNNETELLF